MNSIFIALILAASSAGGADFAFTKPSSTADTASLHGELIAAGISYDGVQCAFAKCRVINPKSNPSAVVAAHVYVNPQTTIDSARADAIALAKKLKRSPETMTAAERDTLLLRLCFLLLSNDQ